ncbi:chalcone isomerase family protein [Falsiroseomonas sp.]|uniref:chalcone isomerase family protein n=1 Tax=Falsiroseomonas sp. TaxID=2870721 RepID=UPI0035689AD2
MSILAASFAAPPAMAAEIAGITVPETEAVQGTQLALRACAVREVFWTNLYVVSLYLPQQPGSGSVRFSDSQRPRLIRVDVTYDGAVPDGLPSSWNDQLQQRVSAEFLQTFRSLYDGLRGGDVVRLAYSPQSGTALSVNGREVVTQPGDTLFNAVAQIWIGQNPVSPNIRRLLLNQVC